MVSFSCEVCNNILVKKKLNGHFRQCPQAYFTCIDCSRTFYGNDHNKHVQCISEAEKYEKSLYRGKGKANSLRKVEVNVEKENSKDSKLLSVNKVENVEKAKKSKVENGTPDDVLDLSVIKKPLQLSKVIKKLSKSSKKGKKAILKSLVVDRSSSGDLVLRRS